MVSSRKSSGDQVRQALNHQQGLALLLLRFRSPSPESPIRYRFTPASPLATMVTCQVSPGANSGRVAADGRYAELLIHPVVQREYEVRGGCGALIGDLQLELHIVDARVVEQCRIELIGPPSIAGSGRTERSALRLLLDSIASMIESVGSTIAVMTKCPRPRPDPFAAGQ